MKEDITSSYLIIGQGAIGLPVACALAQHTNHHVTALATTPKSYGELAVEFWQQDALSLSKEQIKKFSHILVIVSPRKQENKTQAYEQSYLAICKHLATLADALPNLKRVIFVSSTAVYGDTHGQVIDEHSLPAPDTPTAKVLYQAEQVLQQAFGSSCVIVRPSGIYGRHRTFMVRLAKTAHQQGVPRWHFTNRIMDTDLIAIVFKLATMQKVKPMYLLTDTFGATSFDVLEFICQKMGYPPPKVIEGKVTGKKILANIPANWLEFADYRQGYDDILRQYHTLPK